MADWYSGATDALYWSVLLLRTSSVSRLYFRGDIVEERDYDSDEKINRTRSRAPDKSGEIEGEDALKMHSKSTSDEI